MNLNGIALGGMVNQQNLVNDQGLKSRALDIQSNNNRAQIMLQLQQRAGEQMKSTVEQAQQIIGNLPNRAALSGVQGTMTALGQYFVQLAGASGIMPPETAATMFQSLLQTTPTLADQNAQGHNKAIADNVNPTVLPPGASAIPPNALAGGPATAPGSPGPGVLTSGPVGGPAPAMGLGGGSGGGSVPGSGGPIGGGRGGGGGLVSNSAGGFTNTNNPALVNLTQGNQPAYLEDMGKAVSSFITGKQTAVSGYQDSLNQIGHLRDTLTQIPTGGATVTQAAADVQKFTQRFGIDLSQFLPQGLNVDPTKYDEANKSVTQLATAFAKSNFPTRITNNDMQIAIAATPNFGNTPAANKDLLSNLEDVARLRLAEAQFFRQREAQIRQTGKVPDWTIIDDWNNTLSQMKGVSPAVKQAYASTDIQGAPSASASPASIDPAAALQELRNRGVIK